VAETGDQTTGIIGCGFLLLIVFGAVWLFWPSALGCFFADNFDYVTKECALAHLQKPACNSDRDILDVDEITDTSYTDAKGKRWEARRVLYRFRKRPTDGPVSAEVLRDNAGLFKLADGHWIASCDTVNAQ
jgi:hypothetical protein